MKLCQTCGQYVAEDILTCPSCGTAIGEGRRAIDNYRILKVLHEGYSSILCKAVQAGSETPVMLRIFTPRSGVDARIAQRLAKELEPLKALPEAYFVKHLEIRKSSDGLWYRVSEWVAAENWGALLASGRLTDTRVTFALFERIASILEGLHRSGHAMPHLILDDILVIATPDGGLDVKIDYKVSRFLDPHLKRPGPMLAKLLALHPDIVNGRPLDFRSDIWSLGKLFVELLGGDPEAEDYAAKLDELTLPTDIEVLLRVMLADDPDLRPPSMAQVAATFARLKDGDLRGDARVEHMPKKALWPEIKGLRRRLTVVTVLLALLAVTGLGAWVYTTFRAKDPETVLRAWADRYAGSVAFVLAEYWLKSESQTLYRNQTEGTAFLVDRNGYLLTNRHVACPWVDDDRVSFLIERLQAQGRFLTFGHRLFLWFEGARAFKRLPGLASAEDIEDVYFTDTAYSSTGVPHVRIAGVGLPPVKTWQALKAPLKNDYAVLKIDSVPPGLLPLPLDVDLEPLKIPRLTPVISLGFPLGSRTQEDTVNVSVTQGSVRRPFKNLLQVDTSIHRGSSGGPIIGANGKVIGIASRVAVDWSAGPIPVATLLSDIGMVLPIPKAAELLAEIKAGQAKWQGELDPAAGAKISQIKALAKAGDWAGAQARAEAELEDSLVPPLVVAAGMLHFCNQNYAAARGFFERALSMDPGDETTRMMLFLLDRLSGRRSPGPYEAHLAALDWRSSFEFYGWMVRRLTPSGLPPPLDAGGYTAEEKGWLSYVDGLLAAQRGQWTTAEERLRQALRWFDSDGWPYCLALAKLQRVQTATEETFAVADERQTYREACRAFDRALEQSRRQQAARAALLEPYLPTLRSEATAPAEKRAALEKVLVIVPDNADVVLNLAAVCAMEEDWDASLTFARRYLALGGRENAGRLMLGLMVPQILHFQQRSAAAVQALSDYRAATEDAWHRSLADCLLGRQTEKALLTAAGEELEYLLTAYTALGFWAEGAGEKKKAVNYYREALETVMDDWQQFKFALERLRRLRAAAE